MTPWCRYSRRLSASRPSINPEKGAAAPFFIVKRYLLLE
jgi:hypothetical protein